MRRTAGVLLAVFLVTLSLGAGCKRGADAPDLSKLGPSSAATSTVLPVGSPPCPGGGIGIYTGSDANGNGVLDASEIVKGDPVCDPASEAGKPAALVSLIVVASEPSGTVHCPAGGLKARSGPDVNGNGVLDSDETAFTEYLCNGAPGTSSAAGITVAVAPPAPPADRNKKGKKPAPPKKQAAGAVKSPDKAVPEAKEAAAEPAAARKKAKGTETAKPASPAREKSGSAAPIAPSKGWTPVKTGSQLASVAYKVEGRYITVRFTNLSGTTGVRFKYTVRWKEKKNGAWADDSTMEGISFSLRPQEALDREVRAQTQDIRDVTVDLNVLETG